LLAHIGIKSAGVIGSATEPIHSKERTGPKAHVRRGPPYQVLEAKSILELIRRKIKNVGKLKAGWLTAANRLGRTDIPVWVKSHSGIPGQFVDNSRAQPNPFIYVQNDSTAAKDQSPNEIIEPALAINRRKMIKSLEAILRHEFKKASAKR
jgi:hypothetical protein